MRLGRFIAIGFIGVVSASVGAQTLSLKGISGNKALIAINGQQPQLIRLGETVGGITLIKISDYRAEFKTPSASFALRIGEQRLNEGAMNPANLANMATPADAKLMANPNRVKSVRIIADAQGHFQTEGKINNQTVWFLLDTGATHISMGMSLAKKIGIDLSLAEKRVGQTAAGPIEVLMIKLPKVSIQDMELEQVEAVITPNDFSANGEILLGMSYLSRIKMTFDKNAVVLEKP